MNLSPTIRWALALAAGHPPPTKAMGGSPPLGGLGGGGGRLGQKPGGLGGGGGFGTGTID
jgi:hypothetical protein